MRFLIKVDVEERVKSGCYRNDETLDDVPEGRG